MNAVKCACGASEVGHISSSRDTTRQEVVAQVDRVVYIQVEP